MEYAHQWIRGRRRADRLTLLARLDLPPVLAVVDAHRRLRGPYSAAGALLRHLVPATLAHSPELVRRHGNGIRSAEPELSDLVPVTSTPPVERGRFPSRLRTLRIAHGLAEFVRDQHRARDGGPVTLVFDNVSEADATDQEFLAVLLRRLDPAEVTVVVGTDGQLGTVTSPERLGTVLAGHCLAHTSTPVAPGPPPADPAAAFVAGDGVSDDPRLLKAYRASDPTRRARLHDERAAVLAVAGTAPLGALPWHREHGGDPSGSGAQALRDALEHCLGMGFHDAAVELGLRGLAVVDRTTQFELWWVFVNRTTAALAALGRVAEARALYDDTRASTTSA